MKLELLQHVLRVERHVADGEARIASLKDLISSQRHSGLDTTTAEEVLDLFCQSQHLQIAAMSQLLHEVSSTTAPRQTASSCPAFRDHYRASTPRAELRG